MSNTIRIKKRSASGSAGAPSSLSPSELAFNENDLKLYYGFGDNGSTPPSASSIITVGGAGAFFNKTDTRSANAILAGPTSGSAAAPTFRALVAGDLLKLNEFTAPDGSVSLNSQKITNLATPTNSGDAASKQYVDNVSQGLDVKDSVKVASTTNGTLSSAFANGQTVDGITLATNDRILLKDQTTQTENGIYIVNASGAPTRADDFANGATVAGAFAFVEQGTANADSGFVVTSNKGSDVVGTNNIVFAQFSGSGSGVSAGNGLDKVGSVMSVDLKANGGLVIESTEIAVDLAASSITGTLAIGDGGTGATSASAARTALGLAIGSDILAFDSGLSAIAGLATTDGGIIVGNGSTFVLESGSTARASLGVSIGSQVQAYDSDLDNLSGMQSGASSALAAITSTEIQILDGATVSTAELNILDGVTATASELNIMDGVTATTSELNILDGGTSATSTTLATADRFVCNDNGTMKQVALSDLVTFLEDGSTSGLDINGGTF